MSFLEALSGASKRVTRDAKMKYELDAVRQAELDQHHCQRIVFMFGSLTEDGRAQLLHDFNRVFNETNHSQVIKYRLVKG